jgi:ribosomal protein L37AE/L43A
MQMKHSEPNAVVQVEHAWTDDPTCSFCKRKRSIGNRRMVAGPDGIFICDECVDWCVEALHEDHR